MLPLLARRIAYAQEHVADAAFAAASSCERQSLQGLFGPDRAR
jgi:hypothetical protein